ncbi:MAG: helix-turn-helix domain-containing protein [Candidatus Bathyarchaeota archaeon]
MEKAVKEELERRGMSVRELSEKAKIPLSTLYKVLSGKRDPQISTVGKILKALEFEDRSFIAIIAAKFLLDELGIKEVKIKGKTYKVREYPCDSIDECITSAVKAEKSGAAGIICAPILAPLLGKIVDIPVVIIKPEKEALEKALERLIMKIEETW